MYPTRGVFLKSFHMLRATKHYFIFPTNGVLYTPSASSCSTTKGITPFQAWLLDSKMDDGTPYIGPGSYTIAMRMKPHQMGPMATNWGTNWSGGHIWTGGGVSASCATGVSAGDTYLVDDNETEACSLLIRSMF